MAVLYTCDVQVGNIDPKMWASNHDARETEQMIGENRQLVTDEPVEFEKQLVEVQDSRKITNHFRGIFRIYPNLIKGKLEDVNM
jgi:hypothetical protein